MLGAFVFDTDYWMHFIIDTLYSEQREQRELLGSLPFTCHVHAFAHGRIFIQKYPTCFNKCFTLIRMTSTKHV